MIKNINLYPDTVVGAIKPLHGVNNGPVTCHFSFDSTDAFQDAGIPFGRTHDTEYPFGAGEFVDIHCVFPDFDKDADDPASYNFVFTDEYLKAMTSAGTKPFYRLGATIEHQPIKRYIFPPKSFEKWAKICSHIIAHYNEGWANGYHMGIEYWEIWNEPDIPQCWQGTQDEMFELYKTASVILKKEHPCIRIGGIALTSANSGMLEPFVRFVAENALPLDFLSWHCYCNEPEQMKKHILRAESLLRRYGLKNVESICDEWNYVVDWEDLGPSKALQKTAFSAAFMASVICTAQHEPVDKLLFYDAQIIPGEGWNNLFSPLPVKVHAAARGVKREKPYYVLYAWNELFKAGSEIKTEADEKLYTAAAKDKQGNLYMLVSYYDDRGTNNTFVPEEIEIRLNAEKAQVYPIDEDVPFEPYEADGGVFRLRGNRCALVKIPKD